MASIDDEKLVFHVRERLVVHDLLEEAFLRLGGQLLDCGCPSFERRRVESIREEVLVFSCHRCISYGGKVLMVCGPSDRAQGSGLFRPRFRDFRHPLWGWESKQTGGVIQ